jgi:hypothetical protein
MNELLGAWPYGSSCSHCSRGTFAFACERLLRLVRDFEMFRLARCALCLVQIAELMPCDCGSPVRWAKLLW